MRVAIIIIVLLAIVGGGGAAAYFYFGQKAEASIGETSEHQEADDDHATAGKTDTHGHEAKFVQLDPLILPIIDETGITQTVSIVVMIQVGSEADAKTVEGVVPRLKDAFIQEMYGVLNKQAALKGGVVQVAMIKDRLNAITNRVLGEGISQDVLLQVVQQRPM